MLSLDKTCLESKKDLLRLLLCAPTTKNPLLKRPSTAPHSPLNRPHDRNSLLNSPLRNLIVKNPLLSFEIRFSPFESASLNKRRYKYDYKFVNYFFLKFVF